MPELFGYGELRRVDWLGQHEGGFEIDRMVRERSLDTSWLADDVGSVDFLGWLGLVYGPFEFEEATVEESVFLGQVAGCIISESPQGFVEVFWHCNKGELERQWGQECKHMNAEPKLPLDGEPL